jgi:haloalkane dehalogenase
MTVVDLPEIVRAQWPFQARFVRVNGWRMHYVDEGAGDPIVLLHGNPTWGFLYREFVAPLTEAGYRVIIPDMIGFGLSEKPMREHAHSLDGHIANLTALLRGLGLYRVTLVCHDWGGPTGLGFSFSNSARVRALVMMSTWGWPLPPAEPVRGRSPTFRIARDARLQSRAARSRHPIAHLGMAPLDSAGRYRARVATFCLA